MAVKLGFENCEELAKHLELLLMKFNVFQKITARMPDLNEITLLANEMINKDRLGNNFRLVNVTDVEVILKNTISRSTKLSETNGST